MFVFSDQCDFILLSLSCIRNTASRCRSIASAYRYKNNNSIFFCEIKLYRLNVKTLWFYPRAFCASLVVCDRSMLFDDIDTYSELRDLNTQEIITGVCLMS